MREDGINRKEGVVEPGHTGRMQSGAGASTAAIVLGRKRKFSHHCLNCVCAWGGGV